MRKELESSMYNNYTNVVSIIFSSFGKTTHSGVPGEPQCVHLFQLMDQAISWGMRITHQMEEFISMTKSFTLRLVHRLSGFGGTNTLNRRWLYLFIR